MALSIGIVGLPNVGKSTLFNALNGGGAEAANYPFCTIDPNVGIVPVPDKRIDALSAIVKPQAIQHAIVEFVDIAGLVAGAASGEGLGNKFLANIRECSAIAHVVRCFDDENVTHVAGKIDPLSDIEIIDTELMLKDMDGIEKSLIRIEKLARTGDKDAKLQAEVFKKVSKGLEDGTPVRRQGLSSDELVKIKELCLLTAKPVLYVANVDDGSLPDGNAYVEKVREFAAQEGAGVAVVSAQIEAELIEMDEESQTEFLADLGLSEPGLNTVIREAYTLLDLISYFTAGVKEVRAWTIHRGDTAPKAAAVIHNDFEKGFIRAETIAYEDYVSLGGEAKAKEAGKMRLEGKEYIVKDGDVMHFRFNV
ncbi:redox-regulated ATPase YchF [Mariprofundus sp. NF]|uniref:redox-regulated ATPase YchF n=1 Tax=Mariprofundus sp. NF TaxID=2608716 RepID=UPI0015A0129B|nr:redox-regulated ATPase YchF [Mariprofundus sp. NF]NWF37873.1 redox-regulated ATPase YchF [Mariprofundus sp. NF]